MSWASRRWGRREKLPPGRRGSGGASRDRTDDLYNAIVALSQLSYGPERARKGSGWARLRQSRNAIFVRWRADVDVHARAACSCSPAFVGRGDDMKEAVWVESPCRRRDLVPVPRG